MIFTFYPLSCRVPTERSFGLKPSIVMRWSKRVLPWRPVFLIIYQKAWVWGYSNQYFLWDCSSWAHGGHFTQLKKLEAKVLLLIPLIVSENKGYSCNIVSDLDSRLGFVWITATGGQHLFSIILQALLEWKCNRYFKSVLPVFGIWLHHPAHCIAVTQPVHQTFPFFGESGSDWWD